MEAGMDEGRALQDLVKFTCFGCGNLNEHGLQIKSHWDGDELVCRWKPKPFHTGPPEYVFGGIIASVVDCHSMWTAMAAWCRDNGLDLATQTPAYVTGRLTVNYLKPARISIPLELRARVVDAAGRKATVACRVLQDGVEVASADVLAVRIEAKA
jgi:acyl-coenzyme A thioesterase PaaI-like protein